MSSKKGNWEYGEGEASSDQIRTLSLANLDLTVLISKLQNENKDLRSENAKQKRQLEDVSHEIILKEKLKCASKVFYEQDEEIKSLKSQLDQAISKTSKLEKKINELKEKLTSTVPNQRLIEQLEERLAKTTYQLEKAAKRVVEKDLDIRDLRSRSDRHIQTEADLKKEIACLESRLKKANNDQSLQNDLIKSQKELVDKAEQRCSKEMALVYELRCMLKKAEEKMAGQQKNFNDLQKRFKELKELHQNDGVRLENALQSKVDEITKVKEKNYKLLMFAKNIREKSNFSGNRNPCELLEELEELESHVSKELSRMAVENGRNASTAYPKEERQLPRCDVPSSSQKSVSRPLPMLPSPPLSTPEKRAGDRMSPNHLGSTNSHKKKYILTDHYAKNDYKPENREWQSTSGSVANQEICEVVFWDTDEEIDVEDD